MLVMECVGLGSRNLGAVTVSFWSGSNLRRRGLVRKPVAFNGYGLYRRTSSSVRVMANAGSESCVAVKEGFADEEDYIKGGGSELVFVQMQQKKSMEKQSKLSDKVKSLSLALKK